MHFLTNLFSTADLTPHGFCLTWRPALLWLQVIPDAIIGLSYYSIPLALGYFVSKRQDIAFGWIFWMFALFILACGTTHFLEIWTLWHPDYAIQGLIKAATAAASVTTALVLWPLVPRALALPSPGQLRQVNEELSVQIRERNDADQALRREMAERQKTEEALRQSQKMEGLGQLTGGVAHDFNNLLLILQGNLHIIRRSSSREIEAPLSAIERAVARGESLTRQLLTFARRQTLQPRMLDLAEELPKLEQLLKRSLRGDIEIEIAVAPGAWAVEVDPNEFELALINIASNARDAMSRGGKLRIDVDNETFEAAGAEEAAGLSGEFVRIAVSDTGTGIAPEIIERVFEPFFTTKEVGKGTGLGLSQVYGFARQSGGTAEAASENGKGSRITIHLPRARNASPKNAARAEPNSFGTTEAGERVLLVEDNFQVAEVNTLILEQFGYQVRHAGTADEAIAVLAEGAPFDLVFSDIVMPAGKSGLDLARHLRQRFPYLPVLLTTGYSALARDASEEGFPIIPKPYRPESLQRALRNLLGPDKESGWPDQAPEPGS